MLVNKCKAQLDLEGKCDDDSNSDKCDYYDVDGGKRKKKNLEQCFFKWSI
jgi:hypothetical protein